VGTWSSIRALAGSPSSRGPFVAELFPSCSGVVPERNQFEITPERNAPARSRGFSGTLCFEIPRSPVGVGLTQPRGGLTIHRLSSLSGGQPMQTTTRGRWRIISWNASFIPPRRRWVSGTGGPHSGATRCGVPIGWRKALRCAQPPGWLGRTGKRTETLAPNGAGVCWFQGSAIDRIAALRGVTGPRPAHAGGRERRCDGFGVTGSGTVDGGPWVESRFWT